MQVQATQFQLTMLFPAQVNDALSDEPSDAIDYGMKQEVAQVGIHKAVEGKTSQNTKLEPK